MNNYNFYDIIDKDSTQAEWSYHRQYDIEHRPEYYGSDDPPRMHSIANISLRNIPSDPMFGVIGIPDYRFVSEELFEDIVKSDLFGHYKPFARFDLVPSLRGFGGYFPGDPHMRFSGYDSIRPLRLNGRTLYKGNLHQPLDFDPTLSNS